MFCFQNLKKNYKTHLYVTGTSPENELSAAVDGANVLKADIIGNGEMDDPTPTGLESGGALNTGAGT